MALPKPKIFISHSTREDETEKQDFILKLYNELDATKKFEVLLDKESLKAGDKWHEELTEWMYECHGAIILLSREALESPWVKAESTVFAVRDRNEAEFKLIPVLLDDVKAQDIVNHKFLGSGSAANLNSRQFITDWPDADNVISKIKDSFDSLSVYEAPFDKVGEAIGRLLEEVSVDNLKAAWNQLDGSDKLNWNQRSKTFALALLRYLFRPDHGCVENYIDIVDNIHPKLEKSKAFEFLKYIRSLWVEPGASYNLPATMQQRAKMAGINGRKTANYSLNCYIENAWPLTSKIRRIDITDSSSINSIQDQIRDQFQTKNNPRFRYSPEEYDELDEDINACGTPVIVFIPGSEDDGGFIDPEIRTSLMSHYPNIIYVLHSGEKLPEQSYSDILYLEPALDLRKERENWKSEGNAYYFLEEHYKEDL